MIQITLAEEDERQRDFKIKTFYWSNTIIPNAIMQRKYAAKALIYLSHISKLSLCLRSSNNLFALIP